MTDVELSSLLSDLQSSANKLNAETASVNGLISSVEDRLRGGMDLGECWLDRHKLESEIISKNQSIDDELGYAKVAGEWCLAIHKVHYEYDRQADEWLVVGIDPPMRLQDASRKIRISALKCMPDLISQLKTRAEEDTKTIQEAKKLIGW